MFETKSLHSKNSYVGHLNLIHGSTQIICVGVIFIFIFFIVWFKRWSFHVLNWTEQVRYSQKDQRFNWASGGLACAIFSAHPGGRMPQNEKLWQAKQFSSVYFIYIIIHIITFTMWNTPFFIWVAMNYWKIWEMKHSFLWTVFLNCLPLFLSSGRTQHPAGAPPREPCDFIPQFMFLFCNNISDWCLEETAKSKIDLIAGILCHALQNKNWILRIKQIENQRWCKTYTQPVIQSFRYTWFFISKKFEAKFRWKIATKHGDAIWFSSEGHQNENQKHVSQSC